VIIEEVEEGQSQGRRMVEIHRLSYFTTERRKDTPKGSIQIGRRRVPTLIDRLGLANGLMDHLCMVKQLWWKTVMNH